MIENTVPKSEWPFSLDNFAVYFIDNGDFVKIGRSTNTAKRLATLQCASPYDLKIILVVTGGYDKEQELHERFAHLRHRGEWFKKGPELLQFIEEELAQQQRTERQPERQPETSLFAIEPWYEKTANEWEPFW